MGAYALGLSVLQSKIRLNTGVRHIAYADDPVGAGKLQVKNLWDEIYKHGPPPGYNPNATKSCSIVKEEKKDLAMEIFKDTGIMITTEGKKQQQQQQQQKFRGSHWVSRIQEHLHKELSWQMGS